LVSTVSPPIVVVFRLPAVAAAGVLAAGGGSRGGTGRTARDQGRRGRGDGRQRQQHPETGRAAAEPVRAIAVAAVEDLPRCHDFLSFVSGLVSPG
jgi:hypothetical protein